MTATFEGLNPSIPAIWVRSSMVEPSAVNRVVVGSSPTVLANFYKVAQKIDNMYIEGRSRNLKVPRIIRPAENRCVGRFI